MPGRRLAAVLAVLALAATACHGPSRSAQGPSRPSTPVPTPSTTPAVPSYTAGRSHPTADPVYPAFGNPAIDVLHYELALRWAPSTRTLSGTATLAIRATRAINGIRLDFARPLRADKVTVDGNAATATHRGNDLIIDADRRLAVDTRVLVAIRYHGRPTTLPGPMVRRDISAVGFNVRSDGSVFALQEPYGAMTWYPVNDQPSDEALYDVSLTVPRGWTGVSNGVLRSTSRTGRTATYNWHAIDPIASYLVALGIDRYQRYKDTGPHRLPVSYWIRPQERSWALPLLRQTPRMLAWLEKRLGRYPFESAGVFTIREGTGMETQTMVTLGHLKAEDLLHELAHQWFGDSVGPRTWREIWLNEAFATYIQFLLYDVEVLGQPQAPFLSGMRRLDGPLRSEHGTPGHYKPDHFASSNVYFPPALMLHEIRKQIGDKKFFAMLRAWPRQHRNAQVSRAQFTSWLNRYTGHNLTPLVNRWLDSPTTPA